MSSTFHAVVLSPSVRTGCGKSLLLTLFKNVVRPIGINGGVGGLAFGLPIICESRKKPVSGSWWIVVIILCTSKYVMELESLHFEQRLLLSHGNN
jgi:hypothetical protein